MPRPLVLSRRLLLTGSLSTALVAGLAGCNSSASTEASDELGATEQTVFPVTVTHKYGDTVVPAEPKRVVVVGFTEQDILLALGSPRSPPPSGTASSRTRSGRGRRRARRREAGGDQGAGRLPLEQIAALDARPDHRHQRRTHQAVYDSLAKIAPTIANSGKYDSDWFEPWPTQTVMVGKALGKEAEAQTAGRRA